MKILKSSGVLKACFSPTEIAKLLASTFFTKLFLNKNLRNEVYDSVAISSYINELAKKSVDSLDYELYASIQDLYYQFESNCHFCFKLKDSFNPSKDRIKTLDDLYKYRSDPPDVIVKHEGKDYDFELKRYRGIMTFEALYNFVKKKIILRYSGKSNYLVILQPEPLTIIDLNIFKKLHEKLKKENNQPGYIGFSFNHKNKEMVLIRVIPELNKNIRPYNSEKDHFANLLNSD